MKLLVEEEMDVIKDWRKALRSPPAYRVVNRTLRNQTYFVTWLFFVGIIVLIIWYTLSKSRSATATVYSSQYNYTYPLTTPIKANGMHTFRIGIVTDLDTNSKSQREPHTWNAYFKKGYLSYSPNKNTIVFDWDRNEPIKLASSFSLKDRGMELSELVVFNGKLLTFDDRTGMVFEIVNDKVIPWTLLTDGDGRSAIVFDWDRNEPIKLASSFSLKDRGMELSELVVFSGKLLTFDDRTGMIFEIVNDKVIPWTLLTDGDGRSTKGFKSEWATVKDGELYVGSMGKEWTTAAGIFENHNPQYIKIITTKGEVKHVNWVEEYKRVREVLSIYFPGYMIHESAVWSGVHQRWFFLPRRCSKQPYNETLDEHRGCSVLISTDPQVYDVRLTHIPNISQTRGFSSFRFVPTSQDSVIVALRTEELDGKTATYITAFTIHGEVLLPDTSVSSNLKYEGFEFI